MTADEGTGAPEDGEPQEATGPAADPKRFARDNEKARNAKNAAVKFWQRVLADPVGRQQMWALLDAWGAFDHKFAAGPNGFPQPEATWFQAGEKAAGERLYWMLAGADHKLVVLMHEEFDKRPGYIRPEPESQRRPKPE